ncbi:DUF4112 domain-containing protein [cf. Phormidesmis sp. LEGE 11477]|uniref:DUF4112 domain-containing protein n=1 Tax=cf. Phormidesmis sp. LEGE 11477 TaxID=1828680 RepID=UPI001880096D|nr:DUF4112 domain-containing protein [cf. Phormidesmis sp. LEGE 11477]MBE9061555.1 DUF4112 domain-containing protein [cf. Phormidesmis sp. LEGE 11477]
MSLPNSSSVNKPDIAPASLKRLQQMSHVLDKAIAIPGSDIRVGLDPILGLLPGGGDVVTGLLSVYIVFEAAKMGLPAQTLGRMSFNILLDVLSGMVPVLGDLFDVGWKANSQNVALIEKHVAAPKPSRAADKVFAVLVIVGLVVLVVGVAALSVWVVSQVWALLFR